MVNFVALTVIAEFDDYVYESLRSEGLSLLIEDNISKKLFKVQHTTSKLCPVEDLSEVIDNDGNYRPLK